MKLVSKHIILILVILSTQLLIAQEFKAKVSKNTLGVNERFRITYTINTQGADDFTPPNFQNFKLVAGIRQGSNFSNINGKISFEQSYSLTLQPKSKGDFTIPSATITYKDKTLSSNTIKIKVQDAVEIPKDPNDPMPIAKKNLFLVAEVSNTNPYVGENISVVYKIYIDRNNAGLTRNPAQSKLPTFNGFWNQNIENQLTNETKGIYKGKEMSFYIIRKDVLIPQQVGKLKITPLALNIAAVVGLNKSDYFGRRLTRNVSLELSTGYRTINVKALPEENKPNNFNGAVGNYKFSVKSSKNTINANQSAQVKVKVTGKGNLKLISLPKIETPNGLEKYDPEHKENIKTRLSGLSGNVSENYTIVPQYKGKYKIPSLSFSYFNPKEKKYHTINSEALIINVPNGKSPLEENENTTVDNKSKVNTITENDIRFIHTKTKLATTTKSNDFFKSKLFWLLLILPLFLIPAGIYLGKKNKERKGDISGNKRRLANKLAKKYLANAKKELGNKEPFYIALEKALHNYLKAKLQVETSDISKEKITELLQNKSVDTNTINQFLKVLADCDFARYTPTSNLQMEKEFENAKNIIVSIDNQI